MPYAYALAGEATEGDIHGITIRWQASALDKLRQEMDRTQQTRELLKALTENFVYLAAYRIQSKAVKITTPPHRYTIDSQTGTTHDERIEHVSGEFTGGPGGRCNGHVYFQGDDWNNQEVVGESFISKGKREVDLTRSTGWYPGSGEAAASGSGSATTTNSTASMSSSTPVAGPVNPQYSEWEQRTDGVTGWMRYNYQAGRWEYS